MKMKKITAILLAALLACGSATVPVMAEEEDNTSEDSGSASEKVSDTSSGDVTSEETSDATSGESSEKTSDATSGESSGDTSDDTSGSAGETSEIPVSERKLLDMEIDQMPDKTVYYKGDKLKLQGLRVEAYYEGLEEPVVYRDGEGVTASPKTLSQVGEVKITLQMRELTHIFTVTVKATAPITPTVKQHPADATAAVGNALRLSTEAEAEGCTLRYQWYSSASGNSNEMTAVDGATAAEFTPPQTEGTRYYCVGIKSVNEEGSESKQVLTSFAKVVYTPRESKVVITAQPQDTTVHKGGQVTIGVTAENGVRYQWYLKTLSGTTQKLLEGQSGCTGASTPTLCVPGVTALDDCSFYCEITDDGGSAVVSAEAKLNVLTPLDEDPKTPDEGTTTGEEQKPEVKSGVRPWMIILPLVLLAGGGALVFVIIRKNPGEDRFNDEEE